LSNYRKMANRLFGADPQPTAAAARHRLRAGQRQRWASPARIQEFA